jgi:uncharacterized delta-60 repeat protein
MPGSSIYINQIDLDPNFFVWATGQDIRKFNGTNWEYYNSLNSAVPSESPYYLDTRSISIDDKGILWAGSAQISNGTPQPISEDFQFYNQRIAGGFNLGGFIYSTAIQSDGKIIMGGAFTTFNGNSRNKLVRLNSDGTEDTTFSTNLGAGFNGDIGLDGIKIQSDGKILVGGWFTTFNGNPSNRLIRLNSDGTEDTTFSTNLGTGIPSGIVYSISIQSDGKIIVGGTFTTFNGNPSNKLVRLNSDGTEDTTFSANLGSGVGSGTVYVTKIQSDGKIIVGGFFSTFNGATRNRIFRLNSDGTEDTTFYSNLGPAFNGTPFTISLQSDGKIIIGGGFTTFNGNTRNRLVRLNSSGTEDTTFSTNLGSGFPGSSPGIIVLSSKIQTDGKILIGGTFTTFNGNTRRGIVRLNSDGTEDTTFYSAMGSGFTGTGAAVHSLEIQTDDKILIGGTFTFFNSNSRNYSIRLNPALDYPASPLVFKLDTSEVSVGKSWYPSDLSSFDNLLYETSSIYSSPYGNEVLAFVTPLNGTGIAGSATYTRIEGVTGGRLFSYDENIEKWNETLPDYTWPHIFQIKAKGYNGKEYKYFLGTEEGLWVIPPGILSTLTLNEGGEIVKQAKVYNTNTSGIISNKIYALDFDENGNLWIGTDLGLSFFDGNKFWNYETTGPVTSLKTRENGHVFYSIGDGELSLGTGLWHFNGTTHTNLNSSNSDLPNDNILGIDLIENGTKQGDITLYENSLWILSLNDLSSFVYDLPHVYASSKNEGATGWNFTYHVPQGGTGETGAPPLPKLNKYTWNYPEWQTYDSEFVSQKLPGLDPRNLFLTVPLKDIADGKAGEQYYWSNSPLPSFDEKVLSEKIGSSLWDSQITTGGSGDIKITCSTSIETEFGTKYFVGGYLSGDVEATFGYYNDLTPASIQNLNPTAGGSGGTAGNSNFYGEMGFVTCYDYSGSVDTILPFRGYKTRIDSLDPSPDNYSIAISGTYDGFIESGPWVWNSWEGSNSFSGNGVTGSPYGATNISYPGLTSGSYDWIYDPSIPLPSPILSSSWTYNAGATGTISSGEFDLSYSVTNDFLYVNGIYISYFDDSTTDQTLLLESLLTANALSISGSPDAFYTITSIFSIPSGLFIGLSYQYGNSGTFPFSTATTVNLDFYEWTNYTYPLIKNLNSLPGNPSEYSYGVFSSEIQRDLGNKFSFTGITGDYNSGINSSYRVTKFRNFPVKNLNTLPGNNLVPLTSVQLTNYYTHLLIESNLSGNFADLSTLKNEWNRSNDSNSVDNYLSDPAYTGLLSYVKLSNLDYSLQQNYNSNTPGSTGGWIRIGSEINSLDLGESVVITGSATGGFYFSGNYLSPQGSYNSPYYISITENPIGSTGFYLESFGNTGNKIDVTKDKSNYYITTVSGASGSYFGKNFIAESDTTYFLTAKLTEQTVCENIFYPSVTGSLSSLDLKTTLKLPNGQFIIHYENYDDPYTVKILKTDDYRTNDTLSIEGFNGDLTICNDMGSNLFISGFNSLGLTANGYVSFGYVDVGYFVYSGSGFTYVLKQYEPNLGINEGNIISRPGSNPWVWSDSHVKESGSFEIPLMSTVIFNNYSSEIYGKNTNKWVLSDSSTGEEILNIKYSPYFIYTFTQEGEYTIYNEVSDSQGNVYATTGNGFITVIDHKKMRIPGRKTAPINSSNYGVDEPFEDRSYQSQKLSKDLLKQQKEIEDKNKIKFASAIVIPDNPDLTYRKIK